MLRRPADLHQPRSGHLKMPATLGGDKSDVAGLDTSKEECGSNFGTSPCQRYSGSPRVWLPAASGLCVIGLLSGYSPLCSSAIDGVHMHAGDIFNAASR